MIFECVCKQTQGKAKPVYTRAKLNFKNYLDIALNEKSTKSKATPVKKITPFKKATVTKTAAKTIASSEKSTAAGKTKMATSSKAPTVKAAAKVLVAPSAPAVKKVSAKTAVVKKAASKVVEAITTKAAPAGFGRVAKKAVATAVITKTAVAKKVVAKKAVAKKAVAKKAVAKKAVAKKAIAKTVAKKIASKALITGKKPSSNGLPVRVKPVVNKLLDAVLKALEDMKAKDVVVLDVRNRTSITDDMVFASGTSTRHVKSLAYSVAKAARDIKMPPIGVEGEQEAEWVLVDLSDVVVHVMLPKTREFYALERLWSSAGDGASE